MCDMFKCLQCEEEYLNSEWQKEKYHVFLRKTNISFYLNSPLEYLLF